MARCWTLVENMEKDLILTGGTKGRRIPVTGDTATKQYCQKKD